MVELTKAEEQMMQYLWKPTFCVIVNVGLREIYTMKLGIEIGWRF